MSSLAFDTLLPKLRCPKTFQTLSREGEQLVNEERSQRFSLLSGAPDLRCPPARMKVDLPWFEPWQELDALSFGLPEPVATTDLPYHLDPRLASIPGTDGRGRWILEVGCGARQCEAYFRKWGFEYVGCDVDFRGQGPHLLSDAHNLPFVDGTFDCYTSMAVYEHLASPLLAAQEAFRVLKPGGVFFGTAAFVYGFHDRASFNHMTHAAILWTLRCVGFERVQIWPDWSFTKSIPEMAFRGKPGLPWRKASELALSVLEKSFVGVSRAARQVTGKKKLDVAARNVETAGSLSFAAYKP